MCGDSLQRWDGGRVKGTERRRDIFAVIKNLIKSFKGPCWTCLPPHDQNSPSLGCDFFFSSFFKWGIFRMSPFCLFDTNCSEAWEPQVCAWWHLPVELLEPGVLAVGLFPTLWARLWGHGDKRREAGDVEKGQFYVYHLCVVFLRLWETSFFKFCCGWELKQEIFTFKLLQLQWAQLGTLTRMTQ